MSIDAPGFSYARVAMAYVQGESLKAIAPLLNETVVNTRAPRTTLGSFFSVTLRKNDLMADDNLVQMLANIQNAREDVIQELRNMATAKGNYAPFIFFPPWMKDIWLIAAELLERDIKSGNKFH
jgi:hypothetical protein